ncbi:MAG: (Fe-S)-binding protein [Burkholderiaceae bacterium]
MSAMQGDASVVFDSQGDASDASRVERAMRTFVREFGVTAALHMEACVRCGMCAEACPFYVATGEAKYTPVYKLEPFRAAYRRELGPFAPVLRALGLGAKVTVEQLERWQALLYDSCTMCGRCTMVCPMGIDIAELVKEARHGMFEAGLIPERLSLMDRTAKAWSSPATPGEDLPDIVQEIAEEHGVSIPCDLERADYLLTVAPAELGDHTKSLADAARIMNRLGLSWTLHQEGFDASNIGFIDGDVDLQARLTRAIVDTAVKIGAHTVILPECGHAYGAARWEAARWYGRALPVRILHMTEFLAEVIGSGRLSVKRIGESATFHDPCQMVRRGGLEAAPRAVMRALGLELTELADSGNLGVCCGGGGGVVSIQRATALRYRVFELKRRQVDDTGARHFVTSCGQCRITLDQGARHFNWDKRPESLLEMVADNLTETAEARS